MEKFLVEMIEYSNRVVIVEAETLEEAEEYAEQAWKECEVDMGYDTDINCTARTITNENLEFYQELTRQHK